VREVDYVQYRASPDGGKGLIAWPDPFPTCRDCGVQLRWQWRGGSGYTQGRWQCGLCAKVFIMPTPAVNWLPLPPKEAEECLREMERRGGDVEREWAKMRAADAKAERQKEEAKIKAKRRAEDKKRRAEEKAEKKRISRIIATCVRCEILFFPNADRDHFIDFPKEKNFCSKRCEAAAEAGAEMCNEPHEWHGRYGSDPEEQRRFAEFLSHGGYDWNGELSNFP